VWAGTDRRRIGWILGYLREDVVHHDYRDHAALLPLRDVRWCREWLFPHEKRLLKSRQYRPGHIPRATFERVLSPTRMEVGIDNGLGCFPDKMPPDRRPIDWVPDEFDHEISTCVNAKGRGLLVMTSCGHRGVVNAVRQAMAVSGLQKVHAVLGGFHLAPHNEHYVRQTIKELVDLDIDHIVPMHCTGELFYEILKA